MAIDLTLTPNPSGSFSGAGATIREDGRISEGRDQVLPQLYFTAATPDDLPNTSIPDGSLAVVASDGFFNEQLYMWNDLNSDLGSPLFKWRLAASTNDKNQGLDFRQQVVGIAPTTNIGLPVPRSGILKEITINVTQAYDNNATMQIQNSDSFVYVENTKIDLSLEGTYRVLFHANDESFDANGSTQLQALISNNPSVGSALVFVKYTDDTIGSSLVFEPLQFGPDGTRPIPSVAPSVNRILDDFPNASFAFSVRKLRDAYGGSALRVRRSNDDSELDIGFDSNGDLDTAALLSFVGANDGFVVTWYDQSGNNRNATTSLNSEQPQIVSSGTVITQNTKPALEGNAGVTMDIGFSSLSTKTVLIVGNSISPVGAASTRLLTSYSGTGTIAPELVLDSNSGLRYFDGETSVTIPGYARGQHLHYARNNTTTLALGFDRSTLVIQVGASATPNAQSYKLFEEGGSQVNEYPTNLQEVIVYPVDQDTNRNGLEANMFNYYLGLQGWARKVEVPLSDSTIDVAQMDESVLPTEMIDIDDVNSAQVRGGDIRVSSDEFGVSILPHVVEYFRATPGGVGAEASIWLRPEGNSSVWVWYNNPDVTHLPENDTFGAYNVWTNAALSMPCAPDRASQDLSPFQRHGRPGIIQDYDTVVVYDATTEYAAWPSIIKRTDGNLLCAFRRGAPDHDIDNSGFLSIHLSTDTGLTWTELSTINQADGTADTRDPDLIQLSNGDIWCVYVRRTAITAETWYRISTDGGATWGSEQSIVASGGLHASRGKPIELDNENIALSVYDGSGASTAFYYVWNGSTWTQVGTIGSDLNETSVVQDPSTPSNLYAFARSETQNGVWRSASTDGGSTWSAPVQIISTSSQGPAEAQYDRDGDLLIVVAENRQDGVASVFRSVDNGVTFQPEEVRIAQESVSLEGLNGEGFYPSFVEIEPNIFAAVFYYDTLTRNQPTKIFLRIFRKEALGTLVSYASAGSPGRGILFDGVDNFIGDIGDNTSFNFMHQTATFTFRCVLELEDFTANAAYGLLTNTATSNENGFFIGYENRTAVSGNNEIRVFLAKSSPGAPIIDARIPNSINDNNPHLLHITGDSADQTIRVYIDGVEVGTQTGYDGIGGGAATRLANIGRFQNASPLAFMDGSIKHVALYDFAFTPAQVSQEHDNWSNMVSFWSVAGPLTGGEAWTVWGGPVDTDTTFNPGDTFATGLIQMDRSDDVFEVNTNVIMKPSFSVNSSNTESPNLYFWTVSGVSASFDGLAALDNVAGRAMDYSEAYRGTMDLVSSGATAKMAIIADLTRPLGTEDLSTTVALQSLDTSTRTFTLLDSFNLSTTTLATNNKFSNSTRSFGVTYLGNNRLLAVKAGTKRYAQGAVTFTNTADVVADATTDDIRIDVSKDSVTIANELVTFNTGLTLQDLIDSINTNANLTAANIVASAEAVTGGVQLRITWNDPDNLSLVPSSVTISEGSVEGNPVIPKLFGSGGLNSISNVTIASNAFHNTMWGFLFDITGDTLSLLDSAEVWTTTDLPYNTFEEGISSQDEDTFDWTLRRAGPVPTDRAVVTIAEDSIVNGNSEIMVAFGIDVSGDTITSGAPIVVSDLPFGTDDPFSVIPAASGARVIATTVGRESNDELLAFAIEVASGTATATSSSITLNNAQRSDRTLGLTSLGDDYYMIAAETINEISVTAGDPITNGEGWSILSSDTRIANTVGDLTNGSFVGESAFTISDGEYREWDGGSWAIVSTYPNNDTFDVQRARIVSIPPSTGTTLTAEADIVFRSDKVPYTNAKAGADRDTSIYLLDSGHLVYITDGDQRRWPNGLVAVHVL